MELTGARIIMECLLEQGVDTIFGYPGGTIINVYDALYDYQGKIRHILTAHEQGASHAADGYYRATGQDRRLLCDLRSWRDKPHHGIATAYYDSSAVVFLSCNVTANVLGKDAFQEVDLTGIAMPITKACYLVDDVTKLADTVREAFYLASHGRPGPGAHRYFEECHGRQSGIYPHAQGSASQSWPSGAAGGPQQQGIQIH